jgi:hypothetical protein
MGKIKSPLHILRGNSKTPIFHYGEMESPLNIGREN